MYMCVCISCFQNIFPELYFFFCDNLGDMLSQQKWEPTACLPSTVIPVLSREFCSAIECQLKCWTGLTPALKLCDCWVRTSNSLLYPLFASTGDDSIVQIEKFMILCHLEEKLQLPFSLFFSCKQSLRCTSSSRLPLY